MSPRYLGTGGASAWPILVIAILCSSPLALAQDPPAAGDKTGDKTTEAPASTGGGGEVKKGSLERARARAQAAVDELAPAGNYSRRAAIWEAELDGAEPAVIPVQLFAGNEYRFIIGFDSPGGDLGLAVFDARGRVIASEVERAEGRMVMVIKPAGSGVHRIRVRVLDSGAGAVAAALTYIYK